MDGGRQTPHPLHFLLGSQEVLAGRAGRGQFEDSGAELTQGASDAEQLVLGSMGAGDRFAVDGPVGHGARRGEAEGPGGDRLFHHLLHGGDVLCGGRLIASPPLAHHVRPDGTVGHLGADVDRPVVGLQGIQVLGEGLPVPGHAFRQCGSGNVLHSLHQSDQPLVAAGPGRSEPDTTVASDQGGHSVPAARSEHVVPGGLAVVVGVDVDPSGGDQQALGIHGAGRGLASVVADAGDDAVGDGDVRRPGRSTGAVDDGAALDHEVVHGQVPPV